MHFRLKAVDDVKHRAIFVMAEDDVKLPTLCAFF
jgi:hypothetical protein